MHSILLNPYPLQLNNEYSYEFVTDQEIRYSVYFLPSGNIFEQYPNVANSIYWFTIDAKQGDADASINDERIGLTVFEVFKVFFANIENVAIYVCDSLDNRHQARHRKFSLWFWRYNDGSILKEDAKAIAGDLVMYNSILVHRKNPRFPEIINAFKDLNEEMNK